MSVAQDMLQPCDPIPNAESQPSRVAPPKKGAGKRLRVLLDLLWKKLQGDVTTESRILDLVDDTHPAAAQSVSNSCLPARSNCHRQP